MAAETPESQLEQIQHLRLVCRHLKEHYEAGLEIIAEVNEALDKLKEEDADDVQS